jgi:PAS domain-containing protein
MVMGVEKLEEIFGVQIRSFLLESTEDIPAAVTRIKGLGIDTILGGVVTCQLRGKAWGSTICCWSRAGNRSGTASRGEETRLRHPQGEKKSENLKAILNQSFDGVIALDQNERIQIFNNAAAKILGHPRKARSGRLMHSHCRR